MTIPQAIALGFALGLCVSPLLVALVMVTRKVVRDREDPWL